MRVVGGRLRGRTLAAPSTQAIRPTTDRLRETLFNILAHAYGDPVTDARVLDLFAGTGALGIEALSRGAAAVDFVEADAQLADSLRANLARLRQPARVMRSDALRFLADGDARYDVVFIDPPFGADLWASSAQALETHERLTAGAWIYVESPLDATPELPSTWHPHRQGRAGGVRYALYRRSVKL